MAKKSAPWYWEARNGWYVKIAGQRHFLGQHPAELPPPQKSKKTGLWNAPPIIDDAYHRLVCGGTPRPSGDTVIDVLDEFLTWCKENRLRLPPPATKNSARISSRRAKAA